MHRMNQGLVFCFAVLATFPPLAKADKAFVTLQPVTKAQRAEAQKVHSEFKDFVYTYHAQPVQAAAPAAVVTSTKVGG